MGKLMVVDLQGVNYILTDPQIHCEADHKVDFCGEGNLGNDGMLEFFYNHKCNSICRSLRLINLEPEYDFSEDEVKDVDEVKEEEVRPSELSCILCGSIFELNAEDYRKQLKERDVYCPYCTEETAKRVKIACDGNNCKNKVFDVSRYWYEMMGMEVPKSCRECRAPKQPKEKK